MAGQRLGQRGQAGSPRPPPCHSPAQGFIPLSLLALQGPGQPPSPVSASFQAQSWGEEGGGTPGRTRTGGFLCFPLLGPHLDTDTHPQMEPCRPRGGPSGQRLPSCGSCLWPSPRQQRAQPTCSPAHLPPPSLEGSQGRLGSWVGPWVPPTASMSARGRSPVSNTASNYLGLCRVNWTQNCLS